MWIGVLRIDQGALAVINMYKVEYLDINYLAFSYLLSYFHSAGKSFYFIFFVFAQSRKSIRPNKNRKFLLLLLNVPNSYAQVGMVTSALVGLLPDMELT